MVATAAQWFECTIGSTRTDLRQVICDRVQRNPRADCLLPNVLSCRRARTVTADGIALPREHCVGSRRRQARGRRSQAWRFC